MEAKNCKLFRFVFAVYIKYTIHDNHRETKKICLEVFTAEMMQVVHRQRNLRTIVAGVPMIT